MAEKDSIKTKDDEPPVLCPCDHQLFECVCAAHKGHVTLEMFQTYLDLDGLAANRLRDGEVLDDTKVIQVAKEKGILDFFSSPFQISELYSLWTDWLVRNCSPSVTTQSTQRKPCHICDVRETDAIAEGKTNKNHDKVRECNSTKTQDDLTRLEALFE